MRIRQAVAAGAAMAALALAQGGVVHAETQPSIIAVPDTRSAASPLEDRIAALLRELAGPGTRFGLVVATMDGQEIVSIAPDERFIPASNTKIFTTAAAFAHLGDPMVPDAATGASVRLERGSGPPTVVLAGHGDARLSGKADCTQDCLSTLADAVAAEARVVGDIIGDDTAFPDERWGGGWSWNNLQARYGTATSALTIDDNMLQITVRPGDHAGAAALVEAPDYWTVENRATTIGSGSSNIMYERLPGSDMVRIYGTITMGSEETLGLGLTDPAHYAAWQLRRMLVSRGVRVRGDVRTRHRPSSLADVVGAQVQQVPEPEPLAKLTPGPLIQDLTVTSKVSQNLHTELLLRRLGSIRGTGSAAQGLAVVTAMLDEAKVPRWAYDFADGSGMSSYNRVAPRHVVTFLRWAAQQPWGAAWRQTLPVGGVDGTLASRFRETPLQGKVFAKTGSLNATNALSGYFTTASGQTLVFSSYANDVPSEAPSATAAVDAVLLEIAAQS